MACRKNFKNIPSKGQAAGFPFKLCNCYRMSLSQVSLKFYPSHPEWSNIFSCSHLHPEQTCHCCSAGLVLASHHCGKALMQTSIIFGYAFLFLSSEPKERIFRKAVGFSRLGQLLDAFQGSLGSGGIALFCHPQYSRQRLSVDTRKGVFLMSLAKMHSEELPPTPFCFQSQFIEY